MYSSVSCIQPMFHLYRKPSPLSYVGADTPGQAVDSSAIIIASGKWVKTCSFVVFSRSIASRFSRPPNMFGVQSERE